MRYVYHASYDDPATVREILESIPAEDGSRQQTVTPLQLADRQYDVVVRPVLSADQEYSLFRRMNCLRHLAQKRLVDADRSDVDRRRVASHLLDGARDVRNDVILANQRLIVSIARRYQGPSVPIEDLIAEANVVLSAAVDAFDCHRGFRFSTYATHAVSRHLARQCRKQFQRGKSEATADPGILGDSFG